MTEFPFFYSWVKNKFLKDKFLQSLYAETILNRTVRLGYALYSQSQNETIQIDFGDFSVQNLTINNGKFPFSFPIK